jgi:hypothetical protein
MPTQIITAEDLMEFKIELLGEIKKIIEQKDNLPARKWLRSPEVQKVLNISPATLQNLRINGTLPYTRLGGALYYDYEDIQKVFEDNRIHNC